MYNFSIQRANNTSGGNYEFFTWKRVPNAFNKISVFPSTAQYIFLEYAEISLRMLAFHFKAQGELITLGHNAD